MYMQQFRRSFLFFLFVSIGCLISILTCQVEANPDIQKIWHFTGHTFSKNFNVPTTWDYSQTPYSSDSFPAKQTWATQLGGSISNHGAGTFNFTELWNNISGPVFQTKALFNRLEISNKTDFEKAAMLFRFHINHVYHGLTSAKYSRNPYMLYNGVGASLCDEGNQAFGKVAGMSGIPFRMVVLGGHVVTELFINDVWRVYDGNKSMTFPGRNDGLPVGAADVAKDQALAIRSNPGSPQSTDELMSRFSLAGLYGNDVAVNWTKKIRPFNIILRPKETFKWTFETLKNESAAKHIIGNENPERLCKGVWQWQQDFVKSRKENLYFLNKSNIKWIPGQGVKIVNISQPGVMELNHEVVYRAYGGELRIKISLPGKSQIKIEVQYGNNAKTIINKTGPFEGWINGKVDPSIFSSIWGHPTTKLTLLPGSNGESPLFQQGDFKYFLILSSMGIPRVSANQNNIKIIGTGDGRPNMKVNLKWRENNKKELLLPLDAPVFPLHKSVIKNTDFAFTWNQFKADKNQISRYLIEVNEKEDFTGLLMNEFFRYINTKESLDKFVRFRPFDSTMLRRGQTYYWRVCAVDMQNRHGPWSKTWSFLAMPPGIPKNVSIVNKDEYLTLKWDQAEDAEFYEIYGSNLIGFLETKVPITIKNLGTLNKNFIGQTKKTHIVLARSGIAKSFLFAHYRVVAIDKNGNRGEASGQANIPDMRYRLQGKNDMVSQEYKVESLTMQTGDQNPARLIKK